MKKLSVVPFIIVFLSLFPFSRAGDSERGSDAFGGGTITQIGIVVRDIETSSRAYADFLGVDKPEWFLTDTVDKAHTVFKGDPTEARAKLAFFALENITIELIEPVGGGSTWQEFLERRGEGLHHIAFEIKGMNKHLDLLEAQGMSLLQKGDYEGGCYSYVDGSAKLGLILELLENFN